MKKIPPYMKETVYLVKNEDLNHHGTLFAGRAAEWFVKASYEAAAAILNPKNILCKKLYGMTFVKPAHIGQELLFESKVIYAGKTSIAVYTRAKEFNNNVIISGHIVFVNVNENQKPMPHNIQVLPENIEDIELYKEAEQLRNSK